MKRVSVLFSYAYRDKSVGPLPGMHLMLDSGAFTALTRGTPVTVEDLAGWYMRMPAERRAALDVIGDAEASRANALAMRDTFGLDVIPTVHPSTHPREVDRLAGDGFTAVALGGTRFGYLPQAPAHEWLTACLTRAERHGMQVHGFAYCPTRPQFLPTLMRFASVDVSSWTQANKFGHLQVWDGTRVRHLDANTERLEAARLLRDWPADEVRLALTRVPRSGGDGRSYLWYMICAASFLLYGEWLMARGGPRIYLAALLDTLSVSWLERFAVLFGELTA